MQNTRCALLLAGLLWTCTAGAELPIRYLPNVELNLPAKADLASIQILEARPQRNYVILGRLSVLGESHASQAEMLAAARAKAAQLGADFVWMIASDESSRFRSERPSARIEQGRKRVAPHASISSASILHAVIGAYAKASMGLVYEDLGPNWGRAIVKDFRPSSNAAGAGVQVGDEVVEIDGLPYPDAKSVARLIDAKPGQVVKLRVKRQDSLLTIEVALIPND